MADHNVKFSLHPMLLLLYCNLSGLPGIDRTYFFLPLESLSNLLHGFLFGNSQIAGTWTHFRPQAPHYRLELQAASWRSITGVSVFPQQGGINPHAPSCPVVVFYSIASIPPVTVNQPSASIPK